jgi:ubiquinone biosynthesis protein
MRSAFRALRIARVLHKHRLDALLEPTAIGKWLWLLRPFLPVAPDEAEFPRGKRLRLALQELGPIFVKFGQVLSTRRDLLPPDIADELNLLRDQVAPFPGAVARRLVEQALDKPVGELFAAFDETPLASASIAQVHPARLHDGREVVVKVLRRASARRSRPTSTCCARSPPSPTATIRTRRRSARRKWSARSRRRCTPSSTCSARAPTPR